MGREDETDVIRINSQSGKGGIGYLLEHNFGYVLPGKMREEVGYLVKSISDHAHAELTPAQVLSAFTDTYVNIDTHVRLTDYHFEKKTGICAAITLEADGVSHELKSCGNGRLDAVANAVKKYLNIEFSNLTYEEHAITRGSASQAITYVSIETPAGKTVWGVGIHDDIIVSSINALFSAVNRSMEE